MGKKENSLKASLPIPGVQYERGLKNDWDAGVAFEYQVGALFNLYTKYAFINHPAQGFSLAGILGASYAPGLGNSKSIYLGPVISYRYKWFEPFFSYRKNYVKWSNNITPSVADDLLSFIPRIEKFNYDQLDLGINFAGEKISAAVGFKLLLFKEQGSGLPFIDVGYSF